MHEEVKSGDQFIDTDEEKQEVDEIIRQGKATEGQEKMDVKINKHFLEQDSNFTSSVHES